MMFVHNDCKHRCISVVAGTGICSGIVLRVDEMLARAPTTATTSHQSKSCGYPNARHGQLHKLRCLYLTVRDTLLEEMGAICCLLSVHRLYIRWKPIAVAHLKFILEGPPRRSWTTNSPVHEANPHHRSDGIFCSKQSVLYPPTNCIEGWL
jgi:hypothetical protein